MGEQIGLHVAKDDCPLGLLLLFTFLGYRMPSHNAGLRASLLKLTWKCLTAPCWNTLKHSSFMKAEESHKSTCAWTILTSHCGTLRSARP